MVTIPTLEEMLKAGLHFGHQSSKWHPKMKPFLFGVRGGIHIINLEETVEKLPSALEFIKETVARGGVILFVGTKEQAKDIVRREAERSGMPHVVNRWLGGTLTNFSVISALIKRFRDLKAQQAAGELSKYTKYEQGKIAEQINEMETQVGGIQTLERLPDAVYIVDVKHEKTAFREAVTKGVPVVAAVDSNVNPMDVAYPIPGNDDAVKAIEMITILIADAVLEGKDLAAKKAAEVPAAP